VALPHRINSGIAPVHRRLLAEIDNPALVIGAPRRHGKSTTYSCEAPIYKAIFQAPWRYQIVSQTATLSEYWIREIAKEFKTNPWILERFGDLEGGKWTSMELELKNGSKITGVGMGFQVRGFGWNEIVIDDPQSDDQVKSEAVLRDHIDIFDKGILNTLEPGALVKFIGTPLNELCLLMDVVNKRDGKYGDFHTLWFPVMNRELLDWAWTKFLNKESVYSRNHEVLFPGRWSLQALMERRFRIGIHAFDSEFMLNPRQEEDYEVLESWIKYYHQMPNCRYYKVLSFDPAVSEKERGSHSALCQAWLALDGEEKNKIFIIKNEKRKLSPDAQGNWIINEYLNQRPHNIIIEEIAYQKALKTILKLKSDALLLHLPIGEGFRPDKDKVRRLKEVSYLLENGYVEFAPNLREYVDNELLHFPQIARSKSGQKDRTDALVYALKAMSEYSVKSLPRHDLIAWQAQRKKNTKYDPVTGRSAVIQ